MPIDPTHEKAYSPSEWSKRCSGPEILIQFMKLSEEVVNEARKSISCKLDVPYGPNERMKYDVYGVNLKEDAPVLIFLHGGYWQEGGKQYAGFHIKNLVSEGIKVYNVTYDLCPQVTLTEIVGEIKAAIEEILKICAKSRVKKVWIAGHSAGAHLAASLLYDTEWQASLTHFKLIKGLFLIGGIYNLRPLLTTSYNDALKLTESEIEQFSFNNINMSSAKPIHHLKVFVTVGESDAPKFIEESQNYAKKLVDFVDHVEFVLLRDNTDHFDIVEKFSDTNYLLYKILMNDFNN